MKTDCQILLKQYPDNLSLSICLSLLIDLTTFNTVIMYQTHTNTNLLIKSSKHFTSVKSLEFCEHVMGALTELLPTEGIYIYKIHGQGQQMRTAKLCLVNRWQQKDTVLFLQLKSYYIQENKVLQFLPVNPQLTRVPQYFKMDWDILVNKAEVKDLCFVFKLIMFCLDSFN